MEVVDLSISKKEEQVNKTDYVGDVLRMETLEYSKGFKTSWLNLGRHLYAIYQDKLFYSWGFNKFEDYTEKELGLKKSLCIKLLKAYIFLEQDEPIYLSDSFAEEREPVQIPAYDAVDVLRLAKTKKELTRDDYSHLRTIVFEKGKDASEVKKELTSLMKERKPVDPEEEREKRNSSSTKKILNALKIFKKDMEALNLLPDDIVQEAKELMEKLEKEIK